MHIARAVILFAAFASFSPLCHAQGEQSTSNPKVIYPSGWEDIVSAWRKMEEAEYNETGSYVATVELRLKSTEGQVTRATTVYSVQTKPGRKRLTMTYKDVTLESAFVRAPDYAFAVARTQQGEPWKLGSFTKDGGSAQAQRLEDSSAGLFCFCVLHPLGTFYENDLCSKHFYEGNCKESLKELKLIEGEKPRLEWKFVWDYKASLIMDGPAFYIPRRLEARRNDGQAPPRRTTLVRELMADCNRPGSPLPLCKSIAYKIGVDQEGGETLNDVKVVFSDYSFDPPPDEIFRLSFYGLPETLAETHSARSELWLWLLAATVGCIVLALLTRRLARRNA